MQEETEFVSVTKIPRRPGRPRVHPVGPRVKRPGVKGRPRKHPDVDKGQAEKVLKKIREDKTTKLDMPKAEAFAKGIVDGLSACDAYIQAGYGTVDRKDASSHASKLRRHPVVANLIKVYETQKAVDDCLSVVEKRKFLAEVIRTPISAITDHSPLAQKFTVNGRTGTVDIQMVDKLKALELDCRLAGDLADTSNTNVNVAIAVTQDQLSEIQRRKLEAFERAKVRTPILNGNIVDSPKPLDGVVDMPASNIIEI